MLKVDVLTGSFTSAGELTDYDSLGVVSRSTRGGSFQIDCVNSQTAQALAELPGSGVRVKSDDIDFVGIVTTVEPLFSERGFQWRFTGIDHLARLDWRRTDPEPLTTAPPYSTAAYDTYTGNVTTVIENMVNDRCGATAVAARQFLTVTAGTPAGPTITVKLRFRQTLGELVHNLCVAYGLACAVTLEGGGLVFRVWESSTKTDAPVGPDIGGGLTGYQGALIAPTATDVVAGGQGELTARTFAQSTVTPPTRWPWRIETYIEHTEIDNATDLQDAADEQITEQAEQVAFTADIAAYESDTVKFGRDFGLGDKIPLRLGGTETIGQVTAVELTVADTLTRKLTVGFPPVKGLVAAITQSRLADQTARRQRGF